MSNKPVSLSSRQLLAENLRIARAIRGWSQMQLALECGVDRSYVGATERGQVSVGIDVLDKFAQALGVTANVLLLPPDQAQSFIYSAKQKKDLKI